MSKTKERNKGGRPLAIINWASVDEMCAIQCTGEEQAAVLGVDYDTLNAACKREHGVGFSDYFQLKGAVGKVSLRRRQYKAADEGNTTMLVWLGKNWLGQDDKQTTEAEAGPALNISFNVSEPKSDVKITRGESKTKKEET